MKNVKIKPFAEYCWRFQTDYEIFQSITGNSSVLLFDMTRFYLNTFNEEYPQIIVEDLFTFIDYINKDYWRYIKHPKYEITADVMIMKTENKTELAVLYGQNCIFINENIDKKLKDYYNSKQDIAVYKDPETMNKMLEIINTSADFPDEILVKSSEMLNLNKISKLWFPKLLKCQKKS